MPRPQPGKHNGEGSFPHFPWKGGKKVWGLLPQQGLGAITHTLRRTDRHPAKQTNKRTNENLRRTDGTEETLLASSIFISSSGMEGHWGTNDERATKRGRAAALETQQSTNSDITAVVCCCLSPPAAPTMISTEITSKAGIDVGRGDVVCWP